MARPERQEAVLNLLKEMRGIDPLKQLFWTELNYERVNQSLSRRNWTETAAKALAEDPVLFAAGGEDEGFHVIYSRLSSDALLLGHERPVVSKILQDHPYSLFVFSNKNQDRWHFLNVKYDEQSTKRRLFRRITVGPEERLRTASERISLLDLSSVSPDLFGLPPLTIQTAHDSAFDVEAVTKQFFSEYRAVFDMLQKDLGRQTRDTEWAHDYALQFLNRTMFLYFIQRKRWLGDDTEFLRSFWESYKSLGNSKDTFFIKWLSVMFFEAFNNKFHGGHRHFPEHIKKALSFAPFLNGGLFKENELDDKVFTITDTRFQQIFTFLERYNFTIAEDSPLDQEVAVDPEMIGKVYESLVNVSTEADERGDAGIFYTPRTEIDLMCRLALVDHLANHLGNKHKNLLYEVVFAMDQDEKDAADKALSKAGLWEKLSAILREITFLDPACGSGSFIVGMLHILDDLQRRANIQLGIKESGFDRKKRIIGQSLYGVDIMDWACHVAELRLWLALVIDAEFTREELHIRRDPLLPHFSFKIRCGDSLVQEVGGINFGHIKASRNMSKELKGRITELKREKMKFYNNEEDRKFRTDKALKSAELKLFQDILAAQSKKNEDRIRELKLKIDVPEWKAVSLLDGSVEQKGQQLKLDSVKYQKEIEEINSEQEKISRAHSALKNVSDIPFIWDIAFVEIFEGEKDGFDIVVGNPPYVRQENISDPRLTREEVTTENKKEYKAKLMRSVYQAFPRFFGYKAKIDMDALKPEKAVTKKINAKSDLYIYFYFHGLSLLNEKGSFCFITSNSWLDVGYGADLQEFLLKHCHVKMVIDNQVKRSFASADVNTVISLFSSPDESRESGLNKTAKFIMFKAPFEHVLSPVIFEEIENIRERKATNEYRIYPVIQESLMEDGCEMPEEENRTMPQQVTHGKLKTAQYTGNKWGGKYLRAPDIYWTILEKGKGKLVRLGDVAEVRFGIKTGANEFFYLNEEEIKERRIEKEFLKPVIKSSRECNGLLIDSTNLKSTIFMCHKEKRNLKGTNALEYIKWGEKEKFHERPSCSGRTHWWDLGIRRFAPIISPCSISELPRTFENPGVYADKRLYEIYPLDDFDNKAVHLATNTTISSLFLELGSRTGLGEGLLDLAVYELADCLVFIPSIDREVERMLQVAKERIILPLQEELQHPSRRYLDNIIFDALNLTQGERDAVYEAVINLVNQRLNKARSV